jgi:hypothetical protein
LVRWLFTEVISQDCKHNPSTSVRWVDLESGRSVIARSSGRKFEGDAVSMLASGPERLAWEGVPGVHVFLDMHRK